MDPFVPLPAYSPPGQVYSGPPQPRGGGLEANVIQQMIRDELKAFEAHNATLKAGQDSLRREIETMREKAEMERMGSASAQDQLKQDMFDNKITPVPPQEQLTANERDQLEFFLKSPGIGMLFLSVAFYISKTDLGATVKLAAQKALGEDVLGKVGDSFPVGTKVRKLSSAAAQKITGGGEEKDGDSNLIKSREEEEESWFHKLMAPGRVMLTILMPLLILGVQFAYIFFIFKEGLDNYRSGICPGYDVPKNYRYDPGFGADTQVRILVGFVGAYFVFKNISQLITYQRALKGNPAKPITSALKEISRTTASLVTGGVSAGVSAVTHTAQATAQAVTNTAQSAMGGNTGGNARNTVGVVGASMGQPLAQSIEGSLKTFDTSKWEIQDVTLSGMYMVFCLDIFFNLTLVFLVLLCNLYVVFVTGAGAQDVVTKVVILDFILVQQINFKREIFSGTSGRVVLGALKNAFEVQKSTDALTAKNKQIHDFFARVLLFLGQLPIFLSFAFIMYGPICKPGIEKLASINLKTGSG